MINRLEIVSRQDSRASVLQRKLNNFKITKVEVVDVYTIDKKFSAEELSKIAQMLSNHLWQEVFTNRPYLPKFSGVLEISFLPGVTDNIANTIKEGIEDLLKIKFAAGEGVYSAQLIFFTGNLNSNELENIAAQLANPLIQKVKIKSDQGYYGMEKSLPKVMLSGYSSVKRVEITNLNDEELVELGKKGIKDEDGSRRGPLALSLPYMKTIQHYFKELGREPNDIELESLAQTWSEHCKHTIFAAPIDEIKDGLFKHYIKRATEKIREDNDFCVSVFKDNSGAIIFDDNYLISDKVETHNSPSALDPFGGAITGIVGVNRDALGFGLGAKPVINRYGFCLANPFLDKKLYKDAERKQKMLSAKQIMEGVINGVNVGGNCSGIPTPQGFLHFDERYRGKPLVFVGTVGLIPRESKGRLSHQKTAQPGDFIVMLGGRVGQDGIHGATFSSEILAEASPSTAVQIGDPITQKKLSDMLVKEARDQGLYNSITDNGAGGLSCSVAEMAQECNGCHVFLERVPLKYPGLEPWKIWISESQERMTLAVPKEKWLDFADLCKRRGVEASIIGEFNSSGKCLVDYEGQKILDLDLRFLHEGLPKIPLQTDYKRTFQEEPQIHLKENFTADLQQMLKRLNLSSFRFISQQYDHEVQGGSVLKPLQGKGLVNGDATVTRPLLSSQKGVVLAQALFPSYSDIDTYHMAAVAIDTAFRNAVVAGANPQKIALLDNFCWCSSDEPFRLGQLKRAAQACHDYAIAYSAPFISGKDSMFNDFKGYDEEGEVKISVPPTLLISSISVMEDTTKVVSIDLKYPGDLIYALGETKEELGGSEYFALHEGIGNKVPQVDAEKNLVLYKTYHRALKQGLLAAASSVHHGGLAVTLAKMSIAGKLGLEADLSRLEELRDDHLMFSESAGRIVVAIDPRNKDDFENLFLGKNCYRIGKVREDGKFLFKGKEKVIVETDVEKLAESYQQTFHPAVKKEVKVIVLTGYGINCDEETEFAFRQAGAKVEIVHVNDLIDGQKKLDNYDILAFPGGFSYGDDTGSGKALANRLRNNLWQELQSFIKEDKLVLGICNGFQVLVNLGLLPGALLHNDDAQYLVRWVDVQFSSDSPWLEGMGEISLPIAHGEGKYYCKDGMKVAGKYVRGKICEYLDLAKNPNGSMQDIAAVTDESGKILGMMPHPERAINVTQLPYYTLLREKFQREGRKLNSTISGLKIFENGVRYFQEKITR